MPDFHNIDQVESFRADAIPAINVYHDVQDNNTASVSLMPGRLRGAPWPTTITSLWKPTHKASAGRPAPSFLPTTASCGRMCTHISLPESIWWNTGTGLPCTTGRRHTGAGVLGHDLQPNRIYKEFTTTAKELERIGSHIVNLKRKTGQLSSTVMILIMLSASCPTLTRAIIPLIWCIKPSISKT